MLLLLQAAAPAAETVVEDGFSKLQVFLQQLIDWGCLLYTSDAADEL